MRQGTCAGPRRQAISAPPAPVVELSMFETIYLRSDKQAYSSFFMYCGHVAPMTTLVVLNEPTMSGERERQVRVCRRVRGGRRAGLWAPSTDVLTRGQSCGRTPKNRSPCTVCAYPACCST